MLLVAVVAFVVGVRVGTKGARQDRQAARQYLAAWAHEDYSAMYGLLDTTSQTATSYRAFAAAYRRAARTATAAELRPGQAGKPRDGRVTVPVEVRTRVFGSVREPLALPVANGRVRWSRRLLFPGLRNGEVLGRRTVLPPRATLLFRDGQALARGPGRTSAVPEVASNIVGELGTPDAAERRLLTDRGYPATALVGTSGLERVFERDLAGTPGGVLRAGTRVLASSPARRGRTVRTSIDVETERAAIAALSGRLGGAAAIDPRTGEILALAGIAFSGLQPPGSTFKVITAAAALEAGVATPSRRFPVLTAATLEGRRLENANGESCGGTFIDSFAHSCNSVFAPVGVQVGAKRLVATAEKFGFNRSLGIPGAETSTIPRATDIGDDLAVGSSAIGQGRVQASALQMGLVASTVAARGRRPKLTLRAGRPPSFVRAIPARTARTLRRFMQAVVAYGTGTPAKIPGVVVAGKTGTAELQDTTQPTDPNNPTAPTPVQTDAWFVAYAPAARPRIATGVLLVQAGAGGAVAAPAARSILQAGLRRR